MLSLCFSLAVESTRYSQWLLYDFVSFFSETQDWSKRKARDRASRGRRLQHLHLEVHVIASYSSVSFDSVLSSCGILVMALELEATVHGRPNGRYAESWRDKRTILGGLDFDWTLILLNFSSIEVFRWWRFSPVSLDGLCFDRTWLVNKQRHAQPWRGAVSVEEDVGSWILMVPKLCSSYIFLPLPWFKQMLFGRVDVL